MTEKKKRLEQIEKEIAESKERINLSEGKLVGGFNKFVTPQKEKKFGGEGVASTSIPNKSDGLNSSRGKSNEQKQSEQIDSTVVSYVQNLGRLKDNLQEKTRLMETEWQRESERLNGQIARLQKIQQLLNRQVNQCQLQIKQKNEELGKQRSKIDQLQRQLKEKEGIILELKTQLSSYRQQNTKLKLQNKILKTDNKVLIDHIDRLTQNSLKQTKKDQLAQRELRVLKSLYQQTLPSIEQKEAVRRYEVMGELKNKILLEDATDRNGQLKSLIRRLNQQIGILKQQKALLTQQNRLKSLNLQNQKAVVSMWQSSNEKLNGVILKMGQKIMSLQRINQTLQDTMKDRDGQDQGNNYFKQTRTKAGQFYYKK